MLERPILGALWLVAAAPALTAQMTVQVTATPTQAVLSYTAPSDSTVCRVQVSQSQQPDVLVPDVDPQLFPGADLDSRAGSAGNGASRSFVAGARRADLAADGKRYSRALQAATSHFYQITCGAVVATGQFSTQNPPLGNNYPDVPPFDPQAFGNYGWPTIDWLDASKSYIDPLTGILLKRVTAPGWFGRQLQNLAFGYYLDRNSAWTNAANALSAGAGPPATYAGPNSDPLFISMDASTFYPAYTGIRFAGWDPTSDSLDDFRLRVFGAGSDADAANRTIAVCLSYFDSGLSCDSATQQIVLPSRGNAPPVSIPASYPAFPFAGWGGTPPRRTDFASTAGNVTVNGSVVMLLNPPDSSSYFNLKWKPGGKLYIAGSAPGCENNLCTIAAVVNATTLTIAENAGALPNAAYKSVTSGAKVWKITATGSVSVSFNFDVAYSSNITMPLNGAYTLCSPHPVTVAYAADGVTPIQPVPGNLCQFIPADGTPTLMLGLLIPSTGETRLLEPLYPTIPATDPRDQVSSYVRLIEGGFDATDGHTFYGWTYTGNNQYIVLVRGTYSGNFRTYSHPLYPIQGYVPGQDPSIPYPYGPWADTAVKWTNLTKASESKDLVWQLASANPQWDPKIFLPPGISFISDGIAYGVAGVATYGESLNLVFSIDIARGLLTATGDTWSRYPVRWTAAHSATVASGWFGLVANALGGAYQFSAQPSVIGIGPHQITPDAVLKNGAWSSDTTLTPTTPLDFCSPSLPGFIRDWGAVGVHCMKFRSQQVCAHSPHPLEKAKWPCPYNANWSQLQPLAPGDEITAGKEGETMLIGSVTDIGGGNFEFEVLRGFQRAPLAIAGGWSAYPIPLTSQCGTTSYCAPGVGFWFGGSQRPISWLLDPDAFAGHADLGPGITPGANTFVRAGILGVPYSVRFDTPFAQQVGSFKNALKLSADAPFAGAQGSIAFQSYPSMRQYAAPPAERQWFLDFHHLNPSTGVGAERLSGVGAVAYSLVPGTQNVYQFTQVGGALDYKSVPLIAYAGRNLLREISSPATGDVLTDATPWSFCVALNAGECRANSTAGDLYVSVPQGTAATACISNWYTENYPCVFIPAATAAWAVQVDASRNDPAGVNWRRLTMGFSGPGRQYQFGTFIPDPTGQWGFLSGYWLDGMRQDLLMAKLPPWPGPDKPAVNRTALMPFAIPVAADPAFTAARVRFGYAENGPPQSFFCITRRESCSSGGTPFAFESEGPDWQSCQNGCSIMVPQIPGRVMYYAIDRKDADGNVTPGVLQVAVAP